MPPYQVVPIIIHSQDPLKLTGVKQLECCCDPIHTNALRCLTWYQLTSNSLSKTKRVMTINQCQSVTNSHMAPWEGASACLSWTPEPTESQHSVHHWRRERGSASLSGRLGHPKSRQVDYLSVPEVNKHWPHFNYWQRRTAEAIVITQQSPIMNLDCPDLLYIYVAWIAQKNFFVHVWCNDEPLQYYWSPRCCLSSTGISLPLSNKLFWVTFWLQLLWLHGLLEVSELLFCN